MMSLVDSQNIHLSYEKDAYYALSGQLGFNTIATLLACSDCLFKHSSQGQVIIVDCSKLSHIDSAGIALFLEWKRKAQKAKQNIQFKNLPKQAKAIIKAAHLGNILGENKS